MQAAKEGVSSSRHVTNLSVLTMTTTEFIPLIIFYDVLTIMVYDRE